MDRNNTIGILGAYGVLGEIVCRELLAHTKAKLIIGGRDKTKLEKLITTLGDRVQGQRLDVFNKNNLADFCAKAKLLVNCTGPSSRIGDRVLRAAVDHDCHLVDPGVYYKKDHPYFQKANEKELMILLYAGWIPGVTGILPHYVFEKAKEVFDEVKTLETFHIDNSEWSESSFVDVVYHFIENAPPFVFKQGKPVAVNLFLDSRKYRFPEPFGQLRTMPVFNPELEQLAAQSGLECVAAFGGIVSLPMLWLMWCIRTFRIKREKGGKILKKAFQLNLNLQAPCGVVAAQARGTKAGRSVRLTATIAGRKTYWLTGVATSIAARLAAENRVTKSGANFCCDAVDASLFLDWLKNDGVHIQLEKTGF